jgi:hypothetical protein
MSRSSRDEKNISIENSLELLIISTCDMQNSGCHAFGNCIHAQSFPHATRANAIFKHNTSEVIEIIGEKKLKSKKFKQVIFTGCYDSFSDINNLMKRIINKLNSPCEIFFFVPTFLPPEQHNIDLTIQLCKEKFSKTGIVDVRGYFCNVTNAENDIGFPSMLALDHNQMTEQKNDFENSDTCGLVYIPVPLAFDSEEKSYNPAHEKLKLEAYFAELKNRFSSSRLVCRIIAATGDQKKVIQELAIKYNIDCQFSDRLAPVDLHNLLKIVQSKNGIVLTTGSITAITCSLLKCDYRILATHPEMYDFLDQLYQLIINKHPDLSETAQTMLDLSFNPENGEPDPNIINRNLNSKNINTINNFLFELFNNATERFQRLISPPPQKKTQISSLTPKK